MSNEQKFNETIDLIQSSDKITQKQLGYLNSKLELKKAWARCFLKKSFAGGVSTTSRIEGLHAKQRKYLTSNANLQLVFHCFRSIEKTQVCNFKEEFCESKKPESNADQSLNVFKEFKEKLSDYIFKKIQPKYYQSLNYSHEIKSSNSW